MSVIFDQLRISDNGQNLFIDAHVNRAHYFDNMYLKKITICTEDQVSERDPTSYGSKFIYQENISLGEEDIIVPVYDKTQVLSADSLMAIMGENGGWSVGCPDIPESVENLFNLHFTGKFSQFNTGHAPKLVIADNSFDPETDSLLSDDIFFTVEGEMFEKEGHQWWDFKGKGTISDYNTVSCYLYKQVADDEYEYVRLDATDDLNYLHFYWQMYYITTPISRREVHLVLDKNSFNENFKGSDLSHNLFFIYIEIAGIPAEDTPCRLDEQTTLGVTFDYGIVFNRAMNFTRELAADCTVPYNFIDYILNFNAFKLAIETEHYIPAIGYWKNIMGGSGVEIEAGSHRMIRPCGCHG